MRRVVRRSSGSTQPGRLRRPPAGPHLGDRVTALVDDALAPDVRDRALNHLVVCADCRGRVEAERLLSARLRALPAPAPGADLTARLLAMAEPGGPLPPTPPSVPGRPRVPAVAAPGRPPANRPAGGPLQRTRPGRGGPGRRPGVRRRPVALVAAGLLSIGVVSGVAAFAGLGPLGNRAPAVSPPVDQLVTDRTVRETPFKDAGLNGHTGTGVRVDDVYVVPAGAGR